MQVIFSLPDPIRIVEGRPESSRYATFGAAEMTMLGWARSRPIPRAVPQALAALGFDEIHFLYLRLFGRFVDRYACYAYTDN